MSVALKTASRKTLPRFGQESNGILMTAEEFDRADFVEGSRYELVNGVLVVSGPPDDCEADVNDQLGSWLRDHQESHPQGAALDCTLPEREVRTKKNRRRADRLIWAGLGRLPRKHEKPTIVVEFVSVSRRDRARDYDAKRKEYLEIGVKEYWIIDRFDRLMTVHSRGAGRRGRKVIREKQSYVSPLLPGFELPLAKLLALADRWQG